MSSFPWKRRTSCTRLLVTRRMRQTLHYLKRYAFISAPDKRRIQDSLGIIFHISVVKYIW